MPFLTHEEIERKKNEEAYKLDKVCPICGSRMAKDNKFCSVMCYNLSSD